MINKEQLKQIINDLKEICKETNLKVSDEVILRESATYQRGQIANQNKQFPKPISKTQFLERKPSKPISESQAGYLAELGYQGSYHLTSFQASKEIEKLKEEKAKLKNQKESDGKRKDKDLL